MLNIFINYDKFFLRWKQVSRQKQWFHSEKSQFKPGARFLWDTLYTWALQEKIMT